MSALKDYRMWARGLVAAAIGGGANAVTAMIVDPATFNIATGLPQVGQLAAVSAAVSAALYLKQSPLPGVKP